MEFDYIVVQCGGEGTRMRPFTRNMPKALVPVQNRPMIFHLFQRYPEKRFIIIGDYRNDALNRYLETFADVSYVSVRACHKGNAAGIRQALACIPEGEAFLLLWSDVILGSHFSANALADGNYIGVTEGFPCSWSYRDGILEKQPSAGHGVAGCFLFRDKSLLSGIPEEGSFTRWLSESGMALGEMPMGDTVEVGRAKQLEQDSGMGNRCRPYNRITMSGREARKEALTEEAQRLLDLEIAWYRKVSEYRFPGIPRIYSTAPLTMERIDGANIFCTRIDDRQKPKVLERMVGHLRALHRLQGCPKDRFDIEKDYYQKTLRRVRGISHVIPFANQAEIRINGKCRKNPLFHEELYRGMVGRVYGSGGDFGLIHGDCTFSNTLIDGKGQIYLIDARGYFGNREFLGDPDYDWAKLYYSVAGAFDQFNVRRFHLDIREAETDFSIEKSGWEQCEEDFFRLLPECAPERIRFIHAIIWLSLASHCWEDYDSMCLAFYKGVELWDQSAEEMEDAR